MCGDVCGEREGERYIVECQCVELWYSDEGSCEEVVLRGGDSTREEEGGAGEDVHDES